MPIKEGCFSARMRIQRLFCRGLYERPQGAAIAHVASPGPSPQRRNRGAHTVRLKWRGIQVNSDYRALHDGPEILSEPQKGFAIGRVVRRVHRFQSN
jgi:hypothetical protein